MQETETSIIPRRLALLYRLDANGRLLDSNEPGGAGQRAPVAHICIARDVAVFSVRSGLPSQMMDQLCASSARIRPAANLEDHSLEELVCGGASGMYPG